MIEICIKMVPADRLLWSRLCMESFRTKPLLLQCQIRVNYYSQAFGFKNKICYKHYWFNDITYSWRMHISKWKQPKNRKSYTSKDIQIEIINTSSILTSLTFWKKDIPNAIQLWNRKSYAPTYLNDNIINISSSITWLSVGEIYAQCSTTWKLKVPWLMPPYKVISTLGFMTSCPGWENTCTNFQQKV